MVTPELKAMETSSSSTLVTWEQFAAENQFTFNIMSFQVPVYMFVSPSVFSKCVATITVPVYMYVLIMSLHLAITSFLTSYKAILSLQSREHLSVVAICFLIKPGGIVRGMVDMYGTR